MSLSNVKDKLRKLLNLSTNAGAAEGEVDNAMAAATRLMTQHNLTREDVDMHAQDPVQNVRLGRHASVSLGRNFSSWEGMLAVFVKEFIGYLDCYKTPSIALKKNGVAVLDEDGHPRFGTMVYFYGSEDSAEAAVEVYEELRDTIQAMGLLLHRGWFKGDGAVYCQGFCDGLDSAYKRSVAKLKICDEQTTALVIVDAKNQEAMSIKAKAWLKLTHGIGNLRRARSGGARGSASAYREGQSDGANYNPSRPAPTRKLA